MCVHIHDDVAYGGSIVVDPLPRQLVHTKCRHAVPIAVLVEQDRVVKRAHIPPFPESFLVFGIASRAGLFGAEIQPHQVQHAVPVQMCPSGAYRV